MVHWLPFRFLLLLGSVYPYHCHLNVSDMILFSPFLTCPFLLTVPSSPPFSCFNGRNVESSFRFSHQFNNHLLSSYSVPGIAAELSHG